LPASSNTPRTTAPTAAAPSSATPDAFRIGRRDAPLDPRNHAYRRDLAELTLAGRVVVPRYATAVLRRAAAPSSLLRCAPADDAQAVSELLMGEDFWLLDAAGGWAWGRCGHDGYVGYLPEEALAAPAAQPDHVVSSLAALVFAEPDIKSPLVARWPAGVRVAATAEGDFLATAGGHVHRRHLRPLAQPESDPVALAERLVGVPYLWGGRSGDGIDCSGLVQQTLAAAGIAVPRDSDQQRSLGEAADPGAPLQRGDLVFFPGHVGLMLDGERLIHANAHWMAVTIEPLTVVAERHPAHPQAVIAIRRL
jgi:cell wall-associated NlpC family hydrolase